MLKNILNGAIIVLLLFFYSCSKQEYKQQPNVLFIALDDLNDYTGFLGGHPQAYTPNMDKLASEGLVFTNHFITTSECNPSRTSLLTGYHPKTTGLANNFLMRNTDYYHYSNNEKTNKEYARNSYLVPDVDESLMTMPRYFKEVLNYNTVGCGKIFHHHSSDPVRNSFWNTWKTDYLRKDNLNKYERSPGKSGIYLPPDQWLDWGVSEDAKEETFDYQNAIWLANQLKKQKKGKPFFLALGIKKPHDPFYAPQEFFDMIPEHVEIPQILDNDSVSDWDDLPYKGKIMADKKEGEGYENDYELIKRNQKVQEATRAYLAIIAYADACVGVILDALTQSEFAENTIVVLWSDHGWHLGEKLHYHKFTLWDEAMRSPFIVKAPGGLLGKTDALVSTIDIFPTLIDLCGGDEKSFLEQGFTKQGHSFKPLLYDENSQWNKPVLTSCYKRFPPIRKPVTDEFMAHGIRTKNWKFIEYYPDPTIPEDTAFQYELYNLSNDKMEHNNLANQSEYLKIQSKMKKMIHQFPGGEDGERTQNQLPTVIIYQPLNRTVFNVDETIAIIANAYDIDDPADIEEMKLYVDGIQISLETGNELKTDLKDLSPGKHRIKVEVKDRAQLTDVHEIEITVLK